MNRNRKISVLLRAASFSLALVVPAVPVALADPPGYYFQDAAQPKPRQLQATLPGVACPTTAQNHSGPSERKNAPFAGQ
jgi:hypothetical protein